MLHLMWIRIWGLQGKKKTLFHCGGHLGHVFFNDGPKKQLAERHCHKLGKLKLVRKISVVK